MGDTGFKAAIAAAGGIGDAPAEQPSLFQAPAAPAAAERGVGRPQGARNKRTAELIAALKRKGKLPWEFLADVMVADRATLAKELGEKDAETGETRPMPQLEVLKLQILAAKELLPYTEQKLPIAIEDASEGRRPIIVVGQLSADQARTAQNRWGFRLAGGDGRAQQNQQVIDVEPAKSQLSQSHDASSALNNHDNSKNEG